MNKSIIHEKGNNIINICNGIFQYLKLEESIIEERGNDIYFKGSIHPLIKIDSSMYAHYFTPQYLKWNVPSLGLNHFSERMGVTL